MTNTCTDSRHVAVWLLSFQKQINSQTHLGSFWGWHIQMSVTTDNSVNIMKKMHRLYFCYIAHVHYMSQENKGPKHLTKGQEFSSIFLLKSQKNLNQSDEPKEPNGVNKNHHCGLLTPLKTNPLIPVQDTDWSELLCFGHKPTGWNLVGWILLQIQQELSCFTRWDLTEKMSSLFSYKT